MKKVVLLTIAITLGIIFKVNAQNPDWVNTLFAELGPEIMSKSAQELTAEDLFKIYHVTKNINGADDGVFPMIQVNLGKIRPLLIEKLKSNEISPELLASAKEMAGIFFQSDSELSKLIEN